MLAITIRLTIIGWVRSSVSALSFVTLPASYSVQHTDCATSLQYLMASWSAVESHLSVIDPSPGANPVPGLTFLLAEPRLNELKPRSRVSRLIMVQDTQTLCRRHSLTYVESSEFGLRRRRCGKGFSYLDPSGRTVRDKAVRARIKALAIPPAWTDVRIAQDDRAHIQAIGRDAEGRLQYRYHPDWEHVRCEWQGA